MKPLRFAPDEHLVSLVSPNGLEADQYRTLRHVIEQKKPKDGALVVAVTSPEMGDGKTTSSINLAASLGQRSGSRVLLIDADLRRPAVLPRLGVTSLQPGLADIVQDTERRLTQGVYADPRYNLVVLPAGRRVDVTYEVLKSPRMVELLAEARLEYEFVILDTPPAGIGPDYRVLEGLVDWTLLVVTAHKTQRPFVEHALTLVDRQRLLGVVFNGDTESLVSRTYSQYRRYAGATIKGEKSGSARSGGDLQSPREGFSGNARPPR
jgi:capsular exopolysaccharide synthesis family protein